MFGQYKTCKERQKYINNHYKDDKIKSAIWDYVSGYTSSVNDYLRANHKWDAVTKYLDMAFNSEEYSSYGIINAYRTVEEEYLTNIYGITKDNIDEHLGDILINNGYMSASSTLISPWGDTWNDTEVILHIISSAPVKYLDIDKIFEGEDLPSGEQLEILLNRKTKLRIVGSYLKFEDDLEIPKGNRGRFDIDGTLIIECEILNDMNESMETNKLFTPTVELMKEWFDEFNEKYFDNILPILGFKVEDCGKNTWGHFSFKRKYILKTGKWTGRFDPSKCDITLSDSFVGTEYNLKNTMLHEMVHYYIYYKYNYNPPRHHGPEFKYEASKINKDGIWNITPTNDYVENEVSDLGLERRKNRILDEYIICIFDCPDKYGRCHAFRTNEKYIETAERTIRTWKECRSHVWYKISVENPRFGINTTISRGNSVTYIESGDSMEEVLNKIDDRYKIIDKTKFQVNLVNNLDLPAYIGILSKSDMYWTARFVSMQPIDDIIKKYYTYKFELYKVTGYNEDLLNTQITKTKAFKSIANATGMDKLEKKLMDLYNIDLDNSERILP